MKEETAFATTLFASSKGDGLFHSSDFFPNNRKGCFADGFGLLPLALVHGLHFISVLWFEVTRFMYLSLGI